MTALIRGQKVTALTDSARCYVCDDDRLTYSAPEYQEPDVLGQFWCPNGHHNLAQYVNVRAEADDAPEDELECPLCDHIVWVSPEDSDAALSEMVGHLRAEHHGQSINGLLAKVTLVKGGAR